MPDESLFPLPLTPWEEFFVVDDHLNYPANFMVRIRCGGCLDKELFQRALHRTVERNLLFSCQVSRQRNQLCWEPVANLELPLQFSIGSQQPELPNLSAFDIQNGHLWRARTHSWNHRAGSEQTEIVVEFHHALCDGLGAIQFMSELAHEYHRLCIQHQLIKASGRVPDWRSKDNSLLQNRGRFRLSKKERVNRILASYRSVLASLKLVFRKVDSLVPIESVSALLEKECRPLGYYRIKFSSAESARIRRFARRVNSTVNSCLMSELFQTVLFWKNKCGYPSPDALRLIVPFNERQLNDLQLSACNRASLSPFTRTKKQVEHPEELLQSIDEGVRAIKRFRLGINFHRALWLCKHFFGGLSTLAKTDRVGATAMFTNVGNVNSSLGLRAHSGGTECGTLNLEDIDLVPPLRVGTSFAMIFNDFNGESRLGIQYDRNVISCDEALDFFELFKLRILEKLDYQATVS